MPGNACLPGHNGPDRMCTAVFEQDGSTFTHGSACCVDIVHKHDILTSHRISGGKGKSSPDVSLPLVVVQPDLAPRCSYTHQHIVLPGPVQLFSDDLPQQCGLVVAAILKPIGMQGNRDDK